MWLSPFVWKAYVSKDLILRLAINADGDIVLCTI